MSFVTFAASGFAPGSAAARTGASSTGFAEGVGETEPAVGVGLPVEAPKPPGTRVDAPPLDHNPVASNPLRAHAPKAPVISPTVRPARTIMDTTATRTLLRRN
jgi:hypothetical protein